MSMNQSEFGDWLGVGQSAVSKWEREISAPSAEDVRRIAEKTRQTVETLLSDDEPDQGAITVSAESKLSSIERRALRLLARMSPKGQQHAIQQLILTAKAFPRQRARRPSEQSVRSHGAPGHTSHGTR
jgi:transcriptional regulator with XRE-family HTH domain